MERDLNRFHFAFGNLMVSKKGRVEEVTSKFEMVHLQGVKVESHWMFRYPVIEVMRRDCKNFKVLEADFSNMDLVDIEWFYCTFREVTHKPEAYQLAQKEVIRFMKGKIKDGQINDFQLALESGKKRVNLLKPDRTPTILEERKYRIEHRLVIDEPFGIVYESENREGSMFMRITELVHYSTGTLLLIKNVLREVIDETWAKLKPPRYSLDFDERYTYLQVYEAIVEKLKYRRRLQTVEMKFGIRTNPYSKWEKPIIEAC